MGVVALSGPVHEPALDAGLEVLRGAGLVPVEAPNLRARQGYLAGDDTARLAGLAAVLDADVRAIWAARGGYGAMRLLAAMPWERLARWGGWVVGFSDVTALHAALASRSEFATLHGPMVQSLGRSAASARATLALLHGERVDPLLRFGAGAVVRPGRARGVAVGGNLAMLAALCGTPFEPDYEGAVLFLEDVGEPLYRLDRLLTQLRLSSRLETVTAVVAGRLVRCGQGEADWRSRWRALLATHVPPGAVVVEGASFGHGAVNRPLVLGVEVEVDSERGTVVMGGS